MTFNRGPLPNPYYPQPDKESQLIVDFCRLNLTDPMTRGAHEYMNSILQQYREVYRKAEMERARRQTERLGDLQKAQEAEKKWTETMELMMAIIRCLESIQNGITKLEAIKLNVRT